MSVPLLVEGSSKNFRKEEVASYNADNITWDVAKEHYKHTFYSAEVFVLGIRNQ